MGITAGHRTVAEAIRQFFSGRDDAHALWTKLVHRAAQWGPMDIAASSRRVALVANGQFLWCDGARADGTLELRFVLPRRVHNARLTHESYGADWVHRVDLASLDEEALAWLEAAYCFDMR